MLIVIRTVVTAIEEHLPWTESSIIRSIVWITTSMVDSVACFFVNLGKDRSCLPIL